MIHPTARFAIAALVATVCCACQPTDDPRHEDPVYYDASPPLDGGADATSDAAIVAKVMRVATFNTHLFFDTTCDSGKCTSTDFEQVSSPQAFQARLDNLNTAVRSLKADVIALQEIENQVVMDAITARLKDLYPTAVFGETGQPGSVDVAVFGAGTFIEARKHRYDPMTKPDGTSTYFAREFLEVHMDLKGRRVVMFSAHFRSKASDDPGRRLAEAQTARDIMVKSAKEFPDAIIVLGGDLNDTPGSAPMEAIESSPDLLRVAKDKSLAEQGTYTWNGQVTAIDHIILATSAAGRYVAGSATAVRDAGGSGLADSDHAGLIADLGVR